MGGSLKKEIQTERLALGTVQFGMNYGIANKTGQVTEAEVCKILDKAKTSGINTLDTAIAYGESESVLGKFNLNHFKIVSKLPSMSYDKSKVKGIVVKNVLDSLQRLNISTLDALLLHRPSDILTVGDEILDAVAELRRDNKIRKFGISIYDPAELELHLGKYQIDIVQSPLNIFDRRILAGAWFETLSKHNIELHVRSIFLQGLLLMPKDQLPIRFNRWHKQFESWHNWLRESGLNALQACLLFAKKIPEINRVVIGVDSSSQFREILAAWNTEAITVPDKFKIDDKELITPALWDNL